MLCAVSLPVYCSDASDGTAQSSLTYKSSVPARSLADTSPPSLVFPPSLELPLSSHRLLEAIGPPDLSGLGCGRGLWRDHLTEHGAIVYLALATQGTVA